MRILKQAAAEALEHTHSCLRSLKISCTLLTAILFQFHLLPDICRSINKLIWNDETAVTIPQVVRKNNNFFVCMLLFRFVVDVVVHRVSRSLAFSLHYKRNIPTLAQRNTCRTSDGTAKLPNEKEKIQNNDTQQQPNQNELLEQQFCVYGIYII